ncbi:DUF6882 domain-containing protein [Curtobacterium sp. VKM Ac-1393]|uniref:DUF6882 domain-containing protein n=1 Tax=Curtobacterium sp. VKM Ac-1393 TaxID=2783814 RepID=UPI00188C903E|nr:DUF6882 domain-containing protein [Curtobacterium sp. VKM Ac-1393]MBF4606220.1 hypothetical protein [Curtobacterium sp. VKM Ac-1393]
MARSRGMDDLVSDGVFLAWEAQLQLADRYDDHERWNVDLAAGTLQFTGPHPGEFRIQLLGSAAPGPRSWLWGWANPSQYPASVLAAANATRALGERLGIPELVQGEVPFGEHRQADAADAGYEFAWDLSIAARLATGSWFGFGGHVGGGSRLWVLFEGLQFVPPTVPRMVRVFGEGVQTTEVHDHRRAVGSWASLRGVPWDGRTLTLADGTITVDFDELGRIRDLQGSSTRP